MENYYFKIKIKRNWKGGGTVRTKERKSERKRELKPRKWEREEKNERK